MFIKINKIWFGLNLCMLITGSYTVNATSLIDMKYNEVLSEKFGGNLKSIYSATTETDCLEARSYAYGETKSSWNIQEIKQAAFSGNGVAQFCMYRELTRLYPTLFNGEKTKACIEASIWLLCAIHRDCSLTSEDKIQWNDMLPEDMENVEQVSTSIKTIARFLAG